MPAKIIGAARAAREAAIRNLHAQGLRHPAIGQHLGLSSVTIGREVRAMGLSGYVGGPRKYTDEQAAHAIRLYRDGELSMTAAGRATGIDDQTLRRILDESKIPLRYRRPIYPLNLKRRAIRLYAKKEMSAQGVADILGLKAFTVKQWMVAARVIRTMSEAQAIVIQRGRRRNARRIPWTSSKTGEFHFADSSYEALRMSQLDRDPSVLFWSRCRDRIPYDAPGAIRRHYVPDLVVTRSNSKLFVEEIKPLHATKSPINVAKFAAAMRFYELKGIAFNIITELDLGKPCAGDLDAFRNLRRTIREHFTTDEQKRRVSLLGKASVARRRRAETPEERRTRQDRQATRAREKRAVAKIIAENQMRESKIRAAAMALAERICTPSPFTELEWLDHARAALDAASAIERKNSHG